MYGRWWLAIGYLLLAGACVATTGFAPEIKWFGAIGFAIVSLRWAFLASTEQEKRP